MPTANTSVLLVPQIPLKELLKPAVIGVYTQVEPRYRAVSPFRPDAKQSPGPAAHIDNIPLGAVIVPTVHDVPS